MGVGSGEQDSVKVLTFLLFPVIEAHVCCCVCQVYDYDRLLPDDSLVGTAELFFTHESIETDPDTGSQSVSGKISPCSSRRVLAPVTWLAFMLLGMLPL